MGFFSPGVISGLASAAESSTVNAVNNTVQGVERGAAQAIGGAVHDVLGLPQAMINIFYNFGGFLLGITLLLVGSWLVVFALLGDVVKDGLHDAAETINPGGKPAVENVIGKVVETAGTAAGAAALL